MATSKIQKSGITYKNIVQIYDDSVSGSDVTLLDGIAQNSGVLVVRASIPSSWYAKVYVTVDGEEIHRVGQSATSTNDGLTVTVPLIIPKGGRVVVKASTASVTLKSNITFS